MTGPTSISCNPTVIVLICSCLAIAVIPKEGQTQGSLPPSTGMCELGGTDAGLLVSFISWTYDAKAGHGEATVVEYGLDSHKALIRGMRPHDDGYKFSVVYESQTLGPTEISVIQTTMAFRLGKATYDIIEDEWLIDSLVAFRDVDCLVKEAVQPQL